MTASLLTRHGAPAPGARERELFEAAEALGKALAGDVRERDAANRPPVAEAQALRESGLLPLTVPARFGGEGISWTTAFEIVQRIGRQDNSTAQLLGYHYIFQAFPYLDLDAAAAARLAEQTLTGGWLFSSTGTPQGPQVQARRTEGGYVINGRKPFATGSYVADRIYGRAVLTREDGTTTRLALLTDTTWKGVVRHDDWDVLGSRLTATNTVEFRDVFVPDAAVVADLGASDDALAPHQVLATPAFQLLFATVYLAAAEGAVLAARDYTRSTSRPWYHAEGLESAAEDPFILNHYGSFVAHLTGLSAVVREATQALDWAWGQGAALTAAERAGVAEQVAAAKVLAHEVALDITAKVYDAMGARAAGTGYGFDRHWRDVRTHTLHDPVAYKYNELGRFFLNGTEPIPSAYR